MKFNPQLHHRRSIRLTGYDYSQAGLYFITICCKESQCLFGKIVDGKMMLNDAGEIANECWLEIPKHFPNSVLHEHIIMPNHVHGIIELVENNDTSVGANQHSPNDNLNATETEANINSNERANNYSPLRGPSKTIGSIIRGYKIGVTKWFRNNTEIHTAWQRNYHEHIIRNEKSYRTISEYIVNNPAKWIDDKFFVE